MTWITQAEFARKEGVTKMAITKAVRAGRLRTNGKCGRDCRIDATCTLAATRTQRFDEVRQRPKPQPKPDPAPEELHPDPQYSEPQDAPAPQMSVYQAVRTKKLLADIEAASYRNESKYNEMLRQVSEKQFEFFSAAFAPVKDYLINLNLNSAQYAVLRSAIEKAMDDYRQAVSTWNASL